MIRREGPGIVPIYLLERSSLSSVGTCISCWGYVSAAGRRPSTLFCDVSDFFSKVHEIYLYVLLAAILTASVCLRRFLFKHSFCPDSQPSPSRIRALLPCFHSGRPSVWLRVDSALNLPFKPCVRHSSHIACHYSFSLCPRLHSAHFRWCCIDSSFSQSIQREGNPPALEGRWRGHRDSSKVLRTSFTELLVHLLYVQSIYYPSIQLSIHSIQTVQIVFNSTPWAEHCR